MPDDAQQPVPLGDLEIAQRIAGAARSRSRAYREPTIEQLLNAFGEPEATDRACTRIASALALAGLRARPPLHEAQWGERIALRPTAGGTRSARALLGAGLLVLVVAGAAVAVVLSSGAGGGGDRTARALPATTAQATATQPPVTTATQPPTTTAAPAPARKQARRKAGRKRKRAKRPAPRGVTVRLVPGPQASYLCVDRGPGTPRTETTLSAPMTFKGRRIRINVGLSSVHVTVNGRPFALSGSPTGYDISLKKRAYLPRGQRPCA